MSDSIGLVSYDEQDEVFIGRDWGHTKNYSDATAAKIDEEVRRIVEECHEKARSIISAHQGVLDACAKKLIEKERLSREEFESLFTEVEGAPAPEPAV